jgi:hypothetical protein
VAAETLAVGLTLQDDAAEVASTHREQASVDGLPLGIALRRVPHGG